MRLLHTIRDHPEVTELVSELLGVTSELWRGSAVPTGNERVEDLVRSSLKRVLATMQRYLGEQHCPDMIAVQLSRAFVPILGDERQEPHIKVLAGDLVAHFPDQYKGEKYPFLEWKLESDLRVKIFRNDAVYAKLACRCSAPNTLPLTLQMIESPPRGIIRNTPEHVNWIRSRLPSEVVNSFKSDEEALSTAIGVALNSTRYTRSLMHQAERARGREAGTTNASPDERNLLFVTVWVSGEAIGGAAVYSRVELPTLVAACLGLALRLLLYRFKSGDDIAAARIVSHEQARWEATTMYVHRLRHDVGHLTEAIRCEIDDLLSSPLDRQTRERVARVSTLFKDLSRIASTRAGQTLEQLRQAVQDYVVQQHLLDLMRDAVSASAPLATQKGINVIFDVQPDRDAVANVPRYLLIEVLDNLVSNAIRFAKNEVRVVAKVRTDGRRRISFAVIDDGPGFKEQDREKLFLAHYANLPAQAHGHGLVLSKFIVTELLGGGQFSVSSVPGRVAVSFSIPETTPIAMTSGV